MNTTDLTGAFDQIYETYKARIFQHLYSLVGNRDQAEDLTQDTFLKAFRALSRMDSLPKMSPWLYRIATNTAYDALRHRSRIYWQPLESLTDVSASGSGEDPQEKVAHTEGVRMTLECMPERYRIALLLNLQRGYSHKQIAHVLDLKESYVNMFLVRARKSFREHYWALEKGNRDIHERQQ